MFKYEKLVNEFMFKYEKLVNKYIKEQKFVLAFIMATRANSSYDEIGEFFEKVNKLSNNDNLLKKCILDLHDFYDNYFGLETIEKVMDLRKDIFLNIDKKELIDSLFINDIKKGAFEKAYTEHSVDDFFDKVIKIHGNDRNILLKAIKDTQLNNSYSVIKKNITNCINRNKEVLKDINPNELIDEFEKNINRKMIDAIKKGEYLQALKYVALEDDMNDFASKIAENFGFQNCKIKFAGEVFLDSKYFITDENYEFYQKDRDEFYNRVCDIILNDDLIKKFENERKIAIKEENFDKAYDNTKKLGDGPYTFLGEVIKEYGTDQRIFNMATDAIVRLDDLEPTEMSIIQKNEKEVWDYISAKKFEDILNSSKDDVSKQAYKLSISKIYPNEIKPNNYFEIYEKNLEKNYVIDALAIMKLTNIHKNDKNYTFDNALDDIYKISPAIYSEGGGIDKDDYKHTIKDTIKILATLRENTNQNSSSR